MANSSRTSTRQQTSLSFDTTMALKVEDFPFACVLSLEPLIALWKQCATSEHAGRAAFARYIQEELPQAPELLAPIEDFAIIAKHKELVDLLMSLVFPLAFWERDYGAAYVPYQFRSFYATPSFARMLMAPDGTFGSRIQIDDQTLIGVRTLTAYVDILRKFYGITLDFEFPLILTTSHPSTGLDRHFKMHFSKQFLTIQQHGAPKTLSSAAQQHILENPANLRVWMEVLPPEHFVFHGFTVVNAMDVTDHEVLSSLKRDVVEKVSLISETSSLDLQDKLRTLLGRPDIMLGLVAIQGQQVFVLNRGGTDDDTWQGDADAPSGFVAEERHYPLDELAGSVHERVITQGQMLLAEDLAMLPTRSPLEEAFLQHGMRNLLVVPLYYQDDLLGLLELGSPTPGDLHALNTMKLQDVLPLFSVAVKHSMEELNTRVQSFIKEQYTAIHPAVEWRFRQAALQVLQQHRTVGDMEPIVFNDVYPLYAVSDIRGSSTKRNEAIQADMIEHLGHAKAILCEAYAWRPLPALDELTYRINKYIDQIGASLNAGDEEAVLDFLQQDVEPFFAHLGGFHRSVSARIQAYQDAINPRLGMLYHRRREFEDSVTSLNEKISAYLDAEEVEAQRIFPHYFEKHTTDGVEHGIYVGASLVEDGKFDPLYLHNLRLWQLLVMCGSALLTAELRAELAIPLEMTHLVLAHHTPLSIRFHPDEKQFEVDGAYNMRYEIIKKRIDKAWLKGSTERLTQPDKIAIVYSQPKEAEEYRKYINYLQNKGYLTSEVEEVELDDLQGAHGLKALRVTVRMQSEIPRQRATHQGAESNRAFPTSRLTPVPAL